MWKLISAKSYPQEENKPIVTVYWSIGDILGNTDLIYQSNLNYETLSIDAILSLVKATLGAEQVAEYEAKAQK